MSGARTTIGDRPAQHSHALIILDLISDFSFPGGDRLVGPARRAAVQIAHLRDRAKRYGVPCIYVNDNCGHWNTDRDELVRRCQGLNTTAAEIATVLEPSPDDFFILKPRHSGFFATPLHTLLNQRSVHTLVLTGVTTHQCVLFTAMDAYMRDFDLIVPKDCVASDSTANTNHALALLAASLKARTPSSQRSIRFDNEPRTKKRTAAI
jgi:nicotinamidase-related amidase